MIFRGLYLSSKQPMSSAPPDVAALNDLSHFYGTLDTHIEAYVSPTSFFIEDNLYDLILTGADVPSVMTTCDADYFIFNTYANSDDIAVFVVDYVNGLKSQFLHPSYDSAIFTSVTGVVQNSITYSVSPPLMTPLTGDMYQSSISKDVNQRYPTIFTKSTGTVDIDLSRNVAIVVCRVYSGNNQDLTPYVAVDILESFVGTLGKSIDRVTGKSLDLVGIVNDNSQFIKLYKNLAIPSKFDPDKDTNVVVWTSTRDILQLSPWQTLPGGITKTEVYTYMLTLLEQFKNLDEYDIDYVVDGGLSTVMQYVSPEGKLNFSTLKADINSIADVADWKKVCDMLSSFCEERGDCMALLDAPRTLTLDGNVKKIRKTNPTHTFSSEIGKRLKNVSVLNNSYAAMWLPWWKPIDNPNQFGTWLPPSALAAQVYVSQPFYNAPAGLNYGVVGNVQDISVRLSHDEAGIVYSKRLNYITLSGGVARLEGQKTMLAKSTAFDRVNVRRLFNFLKKNGRRILRYYVYEPSNVMTWRNVTRSLNTLIGAAQQEQAVEEYLVICDGRLNTPNVIDNNELRAVALIRPVKTVEFIKATFVACRTNADLNQVYLELATSDDLNW